MIGWIPHPAGFACSFANIIPLGGPRMDAMHFDKFVSIWAVSASRRRAVMAAIAGAAGVQGLAPEGETKKRRRRKKRCKPRPERAACQKNKQCCPKKTAHIYQQCQNARLQSDQHCLLPAARIVRLHGRLRLLWR